MPIATAFFVKLCPGLWNNRMTVVVSWYSRARPGSELLCVPGWKWINQHLVCQFAEFQLLVLTSLLKYLMFDVTLSDHISRLLPGLGLKY